MEILLALVFGAAIGTAAHFALPRREERGAAIGPLLGAVVAGLAWLTFTWLGVGTESPWPWLASAIVPAAVTVVSLATLSAARSARDARERARLGIG